MSRPRNPRRHHQDFISHSAIGQQPAAAFHFVSRHSLISNVHAWAGSRCVETRLAITAASDYGGLASAVQAEARKHIKYDDISAITGTNFLSFALETTGGRVKPRLRCTRFSTSMTWGFYLGLLCCSESSSGHLVSPCAGAQSPTSPCRRPARRRERTRHQRGGTGSLSDRPHHILRRRHDEPRSAQSPPGTRWCMPVMTSAKPYDQAI